MDLVLRRDGLPSANTGDAVDGTDSNSGEVKSHKSVKFSAKTEYIFS